MATSNAVRRGRSTSARRGRSAALRDRTQRIIVTALGLIAFGLTACATRPTGPAFTPAPEPAGDRGRLYIYRSDESRRFAKVSVELDGRPLARLGRNEYATVEVSSGLHALRVGVRSLLWPAWGWNTQQIEIDPGETLYLALSVRLAAPVEPAADDIEIPGRGQALASENVFIEFVPEARALAALASRTRATP